METTSITPPGADYAAMFGDANAHRAGVSDRLRDRMVREEHARLERQGWQPATIVNLLPFPLTANLGELGIIEVQAATLDKPVQTLVLDHYRISMRDLGNGNFTPVAVLPSELANEVEREYKHSGGVFSFSGREEPCEQRIAEAKIRMYAWWRKLYHQATDSWEHFRQHSLITDRMRDAARALFDAGEIEKLPEWISIARAQADRRNCPMCGESIKLAARICHFCRAKFSAEGEVAK